MGMIEDLTALGKEIETAKRDVANLQGRKESETERLLKEYGVDNVGAAEVLLQEYEKEITDLDADIQTGFADLKGKFSW